MDPVGDANEEGAVTEVPDRTVGDRDTTDGDRDTTDGDRDTTDGDRDASDAERPDSAGDAVESFDWRGWLLVGALVVTLVVVPAAILYLPQARGFIGTLGLTWRDAYLTLPLLPAFLLGVIAVWSAVSARSE